MNEDIRQRQRVEDTIASAGITFAIAADTQGQQFATDRTAFRTGRYALFELIQRASNQGRRFITYTADGPNLDFKKP